MEKEKPHWKSYTITQNQHESPINNAMQFPRQPIKIGNFRKCSFIECNLFFMRFSECGSLFLFKQYICGLQHAILIGDA